MSKGYTYASKRNTCPHCGHDSGCKIFDDGKIWCLRVSTKSDIAPDYRLIGWLGNGMGASLVASPPHLSSSLDKTEYENRRSEWEKQRKQAKRHRLGIEERNAQYRQIAQRLDLSQRHQQLLRDRGLTDAEIDFAYKQGWIRTWQPGNQTFNANPLLAGINPITHKLTGADGFSVAACDPDGKITGHQIATDNRVRLSKYIWLSSKRHSGSGPQLPNGELPLFVWKHPETSEIQEVQLIEGGLKSLLVAFWLWREGKKHIVVIGTASAARYGQQTLQDYLTRLGANRVKLLPDAGAIANRLINKANQQTVTWLQQWGYHPLVADWGQLHDKSQPDFDELSAQNRGNEVRFISAGEYLERSSFEHSEQQRLDEFEVCHGFTRWLKRLFDRHRPKKGFGLKPLQKPVELPPVIHYKPGKLPSRSSCNGIVPKIIYKKGDRLLLWKEAVIAGWQHILDTSAPGLGKSHTAGLLSAKSLGIDQLWYFAEFARNVTTPSVRENFTYLEPRHNGLKQDSDPTGKTYLRRPQAGETPDTIGNCHRAELFLELYAKNLPFIEGTDNPVCAGCHLSGACRSRVGAGFGHRRKRFLTFQSPNILAHLDSTPGSDFEWGKTGLIFDEALRIIKPLKLVEVKLKDVEQALAQLAMLAPEINTALIPVFQLLIDSLSGKKKLPRYGYKDGKVRQLFWDALVSPSIQEDALTEPFQGQSCPLACTMTDSPLPPLIQKAAAVLEPDLSFLQEPDGVSVKNVPSKWKAIAFRANQILRQQSYQEMTSKTENVPLNWLVLFLEVLSGTVRGALQLERGKLIVATRNNRHSDIAARSKWNIYLDSTANRQYLGLWLDVPEAEIMHVEQVLPSYNNLQVIQVNGLGLAGKERSALCDRRIETLISQLREWIPDIVIEDWKDKLPEDEPLHDRGKARYLAKFRDTRGANYATDAPALASFGIPYPNIGSLELLYTVLTGKSAGKDEPEFQEFVDWSVQSEIIQTVGRLRSHLRPQEQLKYYFCADYDLSFLLEHSIKVTTLDAFEITPLAGTPTQIGRWEVLKLLSKALETGQDIQKISQAGIAQALGITQGRVSQLFSSIGGWKPFKKLLVPLLKNLKGRLINFNWEDMNFLRATLELPLKESLPQVVNQVGIGGWKDFAEIITIASSDIQMGLIGLLLDLPNLLLLNELAAMFLPPDMRALSTTWKE